MQQVVFGSSEKEVQGTLIIPKELMKKNPGVILIHGFGSSEKNYLPLTKRLAKNGIAALTVNLRGHKENAKENNTLKVRDGFFDGLQSYDFLKGLSFIDSERIGMCGSSFGGGIAAYVSGMRRVKSLVLRAPATYSDFLMKLSLKEILKSEEDKFNGMQNISETLAIKSLEKYMGSILLIVSEKDSIIPRKMTDTFFAVPSHSVRKEMLEIKGATHSLTKDSWREKFRSATLDWFQKTL